MAIERGRMRWNSETFRGGRWLRRRLQGRWWWQVGNEARWCRCAGWWERAWFGWHAAQGQLGMVRDRWRSMVRDRVRAHGLGSGLVRVRMRI